MSNKENLTTEEKIDEILRVTLDNSQRIKSLEGQARWAMILRGLYWVVILASVFGVYYYLQPYTDQIKSNFQLFRDLLDRFTNSGYNFSEVDQVKSFFDTFKSVK